MLFDINLEEKVRIKDISFVGVTNVKEKKLLKKMDFNDVMHAAQRRLKRLGLVGVIQIAGFHPLFQFAGTMDDDVGNFTNRAPYPTLHLLREASVDRAVQAFPEAEAIFETNMQTLQRLGPDGWAALNVGPKP